MVLWLGERNNHSSNTPVALFKGEQTESTTYLGDAGGNSKLYLFLKYNWQLTFCFAVTAAALPMRGAIIIMASWVTELP
jgi:hypothetical protein